MSHFELWVGKLTPVDLDGKSNVEWLRTFLNEPVADYEDLIFLLEDEHEEKFFLKEDTNVLYSIDQFEYFVNHRSPESIVGGVIDFDPYSFFQSIKNADGSFNFVTSFYNGGRGLLDMLNDNIL